MAGARVGLLTEKTAAIAARKQQEPRLNASDATPGVAIEERTSSDRPAPAESGDGPAPANTERSTEAAVPADAPADASVGLATGADGAPGPRRRRRRRRRSPQPAAMSSDRQAEQGPTAQPAAESVPGEGEAGTPQAGAPAEDGAQRHTLRLGRNWRRRHRTARTAPRLGEAEGSPPTAENRAAEEAADTVAEGTAGETAPGTRDGVRPRRRRRRPRYPIPERPPGENGEAAGGDATPAHGGAEAPTRPLGTRPPRTRNRRRRRPPVAGGAPAAGEAAGTAEATGAARSERPANGRDRDQRTRAPRADGGPGAGQRDRGRRDDARRGDQRGRGRGGPPGRDRGPSGRNAERKLYSFDSVVDRGFDDVEEEAETRRVHWTILKRTTADQISRKPVSAVYVLQRDGSDSEFPNLGAARSAVNKTIVHPEKLTRSKEEYAAEKSGKR